jgi:hypothetical protein
VGLSAEVGTPYGQDFWQTLGVLMIVNAISGMGLQIEAHTQTRKIVAEK